MPWPARAEPRRRSPAFDRPPFVRCASICALAALLFASACRDRAGETGGAQAGVDALVYELALRVEPERLYVRGHARITLARAETLAVLRLRLAALRVDSVRVGGVRAAAERAGDQVRVPLPPGADTLLVEVFYQGVPDRGLYAEPHHGQRVVFTDSWPERVRGWLPALDHPADPAAFVLALDLPLPYEAVASGRLAGLDTLGDRVVSRWRLDTPAPVYSFAFAAADFRVITAAGSAAGVEVRYHLLEEDAGRVEGLDRTPASLAFFARRLGPYPFATYAVVQVPIAYAGMENAAAPFLQADLFDEPARGPGNPVEAVQVHEAAHQWFGNRVVIAAWRDLWLSEGMATYLTTLFYEEADGPDAARRLRVEMTELAPRLARSALVPAEIDDPEAFLTWLPYKKGGCVLHLIRLTLGDAAFFAALARTYETYAGKPLSSEQFRRMLEQESGRTLKPLFDYWVYGARLPVLRTAWDAAARTLTWRIEEDEGLLGAVPFELRVRQNGRAYYVPAGEKRLVLPAAEAPDAVHPVGILMDVQEE